MYVRYPTNQKLNQSEEIVLLRHETLVKALQPDNLWSDQSLEIDPDLPPGWRTIRDTSGTYYWHVPTGTTQWQHPACTSDISLGSEKLSAALSTTLGHKAVVPDAATVSRISRGGKFTNSMPPSSSINLRTELPWQDSSLQPNSDPDSKVEQAFVSYQCSPSPNGWQAILRYPPHETLDSEGLSLTLKAPANSLHCRRTFFHGDRDRDFAYVASDKDTCMLKCHVFHCNSPAKAIATTLHQMCSQIMAERAMTSDSPNVVGTEEGICSADLPLQVDLLEAVRQSVQRFNVQYIGSLPVANSMGMKLVNGVIRSLVDSVDRHDWPSVLLQVTDTTLSVCKGEDSGVPWWECRVRYLTFLGIGKDPCTFGLIVDTGLQRFECHVFWCEPDAGCISEAIQAACMLQYQKCLVAATPSSRPKRATRSPSPPAGLKKHLSHPVIDGAGPAPGPLHSAPKCTGGSNLKRGVLALLGSFKHKQSVLQIP
ncbi:amyloid-beta A4 precursor protein-binding family B member 2-like [Scyliorhinus canicula]|uniref:amyloid-beta A4 precursor protein-binding family B member 2-like n=1 Tax=Scyliorhinus canicula TaxID=7830 RepID=UPI0018F51B5B|nr:amyloid-beta A4 precursor protein-binding family B member 2-like [Scyliorhinus canicula]